MFKQIFLILSLTLLASSFNFREKSIVSQEVSAIPWPFTVCGDGDWTIEKLTIGETPKRNINDEITVVRISFNLDRNSQ